MRTLTKDEVKTIISNAPVGSNPNTIVEALVNKGYTLEGFNDQPQPQQDGMVKSLIKDVANTLVVKPALRAGQAISGTISQAIIDKMPDTNPNKATYQTNLDKQLSQDTQVPIFGNIEAQKAIGEGGGRQIAGEALKIGSYLFPYGKVAGAVGGTLLGASKLTPMALKTAQVAGNVASGVSGGYMADVGFNLADENKTLGESFIPGFGTALGGAIPFASPAVKALRGKGKTATDVTKRVIQGQTKDIPLAEQAFKNIDTKGVTTRQQLSERLGSAMKKQMNLVDEQLAKDPRALSLDDYAIRVKNNAGQEVKTDVISQALSHLEDFYKNAGDNLSASNVNLIKQKAVSGGLTHQEVNNIARLYSEEFGSKAFNKVGDPLTSVNAQMFENTRNGLKQASRGGLGYGEEARTADRLYSAMNNTKRLIDNGVEKVNALEGKLKQRNILQKLSYGAVKVLNAVTGGALKAGVEALGVSNVGNKIDNWINLENSLKKDLQFIEKANSIKEESKLIKFIEDYAKKFKFPGDMAVDDLSARGKQLKNTPNKQGGFVSLGQSDNALPNQRKTNTTKNIIPNTSNISPNSTTKTLKGNGTISENSLISEAKKYKSAEEFIKNTIPSYGKPPGNPLYHGTSANIKSGKLTFGAGDGAKKGGQSGGHFLSDSKQVSEVFAGNNGKVYIVDPSYKKNILDLTQPKGVKEFENYIGNKYKTYDGEILEFTKNDFDIMFPNGKTDFASISQYPELVEQMTKRKGYKGIAFDEYAGGNTAKTYQILHSDNIPVIEQSKISNSDLSRLIKEKIKAETDVTDLRLEEYGRNQDGYLTDSQIEDLDYLEKRIREIDNILLSSDYKSQLTDIWNKAQGGADDIITEAKKYKSAEEFVKKQPLVYHGTATKLKSFNNKQGTFFTDDMMNAEGYAGGENVYEGVLNFKNPLVIDAKGRLYNDLKTPYGKSTVEIVGKVDSKKYDGVIFKNIKDSWIDDVDAQDPSTIYYAFKPRDSFLNESQLIDIWKQANKK